MLILANTPDITNKCAYKFTLLQQAEKDLHRVRQQLDDMTTMAKPELERYNRQRVRTWQEVLVKMAETEVSFTPYSVCMHVS